MSSFLISLHGPALEGAMGSIAEWLESLGLSEYMQRFADNGIDFLFSAT
jgi:hypothetical protein